MIPKQARYRAALRPDMWRSSDLIELYRLCICSFLCPMIFMAVIVSTQTCLNLLTVKCRRSYNPWSTIPALRQAPQRPSEGAPTVSRYTGTLVECLSVVLYAPQRMCRTPSPCLALSLMVSLHRMSLITSSSLSRLATRKNRP